MKKHLSENVRSSLASLACVFLWACASEDPNLASNPEDVEPDLNQIRLEAQAALTGNGSPSGSHYNLNFIGVPKDKSADMTGNEGRRIFVKLDGKTKVLLSEGDFTVLDANGTDGTASFQLPNPDPENDGVTKYSVFARALGKPGGSATITTCATDVATGEEYCSIYATVMVRDKGRSLFTDISRDLLYIYADLDGDGTVERYPLFDPALQGYYWDYDNNGLKLIQLRFYPIPSEVGG